MNFDIREVGGVRILDLRGEITIESGDEALRSALNRLLEGGHAKIILNLKDVTFIDSAGIGEMIAGAAAVKEKGGGIKIANPSPRAEIVLRRFPQNFQLFENESDALNAFASRD